jgi:hypothetical protein
MAKLHENWSKRHTEQTAGSAVWLAAQTLNTLAAALNCHPHQNRSPAHSRAGAMPLSSNGLTAPLCALLLLRLQQHQTLMKSHRIIESHAHND